MMRPERNRPSTLAGHEEKIALPGRLRNLKGRPSSAERSRLDSPDRSAYDFQEIAMMSTFVLFRRSIKKCYDRIESDRTSTAEIR